MTNGCADNENSENNGEHRRDNSRNENLTNDSHSSEENVTGTSEGNNEGNDSNGNSHDFNIFDGIMDTIMGTNRNRSQSPVSTPVISSLGNNTTTATTATTTRDTTGPPGVSGEIDATNGVNLSSGSTNSNALRTGTDSNSGAIIITVNYVFSDESNPQNPNRSGSLVMTLPNNSSNRDPRIIQEFIRLATQMAYSTIVNGIHKGTTIDKFDSFEVKSLEELTDQSKVCSICFEDYKSTADIPNNKKRPVDNDIEQKEDNALPKKRKLNVNNSEADGTSISSTLQGTSTASTNANSARPKYLSEFTGTFEHFPVQMPCGHIFGRSCLFEWLKNHSTCPLCRDSVSETNNDSTGNLQNDNMPNNLIRMLNRPTGLTDFINSLTSNRDSEMPVRRVLRSGNGLAESNSPYTQIHTHTFPHSDETTDQNEHNDGNHRQESGIFSHLLNFLRRSQPNNDTDPIFPSEVSSRRNTTTGSVDTLSTNSRQANNASAEDNVLDFMHLRSLVDDNNDNGTGENFNIEGTGNNSNDASTNTSNNNDNNDTNGHHSTNNDANNTSN